MRDFYLSSEELAQTARKYVLEYPEHAEAALQMAGIMPAAMSSLFPIRTISPPGFPWEPRSIGCTIRAGTRYSPWVSTATGICLISARPIQ